MRLLIITNNPERASFRQRVGAYLDILAGHGIETKVAVLPKGFFARGELFRRAARFDGVFLHKKKLNPCDAFRLRRHSKSIIYSFDDAIMYSDRRPESYSRAHFVPFRRTVRLADRYAQWRASGGDLPMPHYGKQLVVAEYAERFGAKVLVETGTYTGHMVLAMLDRFEEIYSIELDAVLHAKAKRLFVRHRHVHLLQGASEEVLPKVLEQVRQPCVFWLDAHYSGGQTARGVHDTPILQEIGRILRHCCADEHVLLMDDARSFTGQGGYPTLDELRNAILAAKPGYSFAVQDDIIRAHRPRAGCDGSGYRIGRQQANVSRAVGT